MRKPNKVLRIGFLVAAGICVILGARLFDLQVIRANQLQKDVAKQRVQGKLEHPERGKLLDSNGNVMAMSLVTYNIAIHPDILKTEDRKKEVTDWLSEALEEPKDEMRKLVESKGKDGKSLPWVSVKKKVPFEQAQKLKNHKDASIEIEQVPLRYYPNGDLGANYLGFVNQGNVPGAGLELSLDRYLSGKPGYTVAERGRSGKVIPVGYENIISPMDGYNVTLTIDSYIQYVLEKRLKQGMEELKAVGIHGIVMNPKNGEVLAMSSFPSYDSNNYAKTDNKLWNNNIASFTYEPGSIMKPLVMGMALEYGTINENSSWDDNGSISVGKHTIRDWNRVGWGHVNLEEIIIHSSNVGMVEIGKTMTGKQMYDGLKKAGFGEKTGIEMPIEEVGIMPKKENFETAITKATVSFGQGISTTPVMMAKGYAQIANGGYKVTPHMVKKVEDRHNNVIYSFEEKEKEEIYSPKVNANIKSYLKKNTEVGSGKGGAIEGYDQGSKTGTAQKAENGRYKDGAIIGSYVGFAPLENSEYVLLISVDEPNVEYGNQAASPIYKDVMTELLAYKHIPKKGEVKKEVRLDVPDVKWFTVNKAKEKLNQQNIEVKVTGKGEIVVDQRYSYQNGKLVVSLETKGFTTKDKWNIPNLVGMSLEEVEKLSLGIPVVTRGSGVVTEQSMPPGEHVKDGKELYVWLK
ncbi:stage V sporulation protein D [Bacillus luti]